MDKVQHEYYQALLQKLAMPKIREGVDNNDESSRDFRDTFANIMRATPMNVNHHHQVLKAAWLASPLGPILVVADEKGLYLLEFVDGRSLEREITRLRFKHPFAIIPGSCPPIIAIEAELKAYFAGKLKQFTTPLHLLGSPFQQQVWTQLLRIPYGETRSYLEQAQAIGKAKAYRAVANANGANQLAIIIPCHRIINHNGGLGGYDGGLARKKWLLDHEKRHR